MHIAMIHMCYKRNFKVYEAEKFDEDRKEGSKCNDQKGNVRKHLYQLHNGNISRKVKQTFR